jgi:mycofactocin precursor
MMTLDTAAQTAPIDRHETVDVAPEHAVTQPPRVAGEDLVEADLLVEDVSIDGMCGVY